MEKVITDANYDAIVAEGLPVVLDFSATWRRLPGKSLYDSRNRFARQECPVRMIPYYAFANRGVSDMLVWVHVK